MATVSNLSGRLLLVVVLGYWRLKSISSNLMGGLLGSLAFFSGHGHGG
jgi:hypothetical protein